MCSFVLSKIVLLVCVSAIASAQEDDNITLDIPLEERWVNDGPTRLKLIREWTQLDWAYSTDEDRQTAIGNGDFIPGAPVPIDIDIFFPQDRNKFKLFMTVPRFQLGVPAALNTVGYQSLLHPYPDWSWHRNPRSCPTNRIVSVYRVMVDECSRLWVLDTGMLETTIICRPQLLAFDLNTNNVLVQYEFPADQYFPETILVTPVVDVRDPPGQSGGQCKDTFVYIGDVTRYGLIVFNAATRTSWRINSNLFYPYPPFGYFEIQGEGFDLMDGILGMALSPYRPGEDRVLYFHALASATENSVQTSVIRNEARFQGNPDAAQRDFYLYPNGRRTQSVAEAIDRNGVAYFGLVSDTSIACWNTRTDYGVKNIHTIEKNEQTLQFASGVKVVTDRNGRQQLWVITVRFQKTMAGTRNPEEVNFRVHAADIENVLQQSKCRPTGGYGLATPRPWNKKPSSAAGNIQFRFGNTPLNHTDMDAVVFPTAT